MYTQMYICLLCWVSSSIEKTTKLKKIATIYPVIWIWLLTLSFKDRHYLHKLSSSDPSCLIFFQLPLKVIISELWLEKHLLCFSDFTYNRIVFRWITSNLLEKSHNLVAYAKRKQSVQCTVCLSPSRDRRILLPTKVLEKCSQLKAFIQFQLFESIKY